MTVRWRLLEWWGVAICLFLQTGGVFVMLALGPEGELSDAARAKLRLLSLPVYLIAAVLLSPHRGQLLAAVRRNLPIVALLAVPFLSVLWSVGPSISLRRAVGLLGSVALSYLIAIRFTPRQIMLLVALAIGPAIVLSLLMIGVSPRLAFMPESHELRGVFVHKNVLGRSAVLACIAAAAIAFDGSLGMRRGGLLLLAASIAALLLSQSVTALFTGIVALSLVWPYALLARCRGRDRVLVALLILQVAAAALIFLDQLLVPLLEALGKDATLTGRVPLWHLVDMRIERRLLLGFGYQSFWTTGSPDAWAIWGAVGWMPPNAHSGYRETLLGTGLVGFTLLLVVTARATWQGASLHVGDPEGGWLGLNLFVGSFLVMNLTESMFMLQNDIYWTLFMSCAIAFSLRHREAAARRSVRADDASRGSSPRAVRLPVA